MARCLAGRHERIQETNRSEIISLIQNPIEWVFRKEQVHNFASEYRIVFPIVDHNGNVIPVRGKKILRLTPELGVSTIQRKHNKTVYPMAGSALFSQFGLRKNSRQLLLPAMDNLSVSRRLRQPIPSCQLPPCWIQHWGLNGSVQVSCF